MTRDPIERRERREIIYAEVVAFRQLQEEFGQPNHQRNSTDFINGEWQLGWWWHGAVDNGGGCVLPLLVAGASWPGMRCVLRFENSNYYSG